MFQETVTPSSGMENDGNATNFKDADWDLVSFFIFF
jgi:hypothetical protein